MHRLGDNHCLRRSKASRLPQTDRLLQVLAKSYMLDFDTLGAVTKAVDPFWVSYLSRGSGLGITWDKLNVLP